MYVCTYVYIHSGNILSRECLFLFIKMANVRYKRFKQSRQVKKGYKTPQIPPPRNNQGTSLQMSPSVCGQKDVSKRQTECNRRKGHEERKLDDFKKLNKARKWIFP